MSYTRINWQDLPNTTTPRNATNLNKMDSAIKEHDDMLSGNTAIEKVVVGSVEGKNLVNVANQTISAGILLTKIDTSDITGNITLSLNYNNTSSVNGVLRLRETEAGSNLSSIVLTANYSGKAQGTLDVTNYDTIYVIAQGTSSGYNYSISNFQVEKGSIATNFVPFMKYGYNSEESMGNIVVDDIQGKNLLDISNFSTTTINDITFTKNSDGTITANGTASADAIINLFANNFSLKVGTYTLSGCPSNGGSSNYFIATNIGGSSIYDYGSGVTKTITNDNSGRSIWITIKSGVTVSNLVFKPMIEKGSEATSYTPYKSFDSTGYVLWTNPSPTSEFASQSITLNSDDYSYFDLYYKQSTNSSYVMCARVLKGYGSRISFSTLYSSSSGGLLFQRNLTRTNDTTFTLGNCEKQSGTTITTENTSIIPLKIIGHK